MEYQFQTFKSERVILISLDTLVEANLAAKEASGPEDFHFPTMGNRQKRREKRTMIDLRPLLSDIRS